MLHASSNQHLTVPNLVLLTYNIKKYPQGKETEQYDIPMHNGSTDSAKLKATDMVKLDTSLGEREQAISEKKWTMFQLISFLSTVLHEQSPI